MTTSTAFLNPYRTALFSHHDPHERWPALFEVHADLPADVLWTLIREVWENSKSNYRHNEIIRRMITAEMINAPERLAAFSDDDKEMWKLALRRGKPIKVYRGGARPNMTGLTWTTRDDLAAYWAHHSGFDETTLAIGRVEPRHIILALRPIKTVMLFPEHVEIEKVETLPGLEGQPLGSRRIQAMVEAYGANAPLEMTPAEYFKMAVAEGKIDPKVIIDHMKTSRNFLTGLGFKIRVETIDTILTAMEDGDVRSA